MSQPDAADNDGQIPSHTLYLFAMCVSVTASLVLLLADLSGRIEFPRGLYSILVGTFVLTGCGYLVRSAEDRMMRRLESNGRSPDQVNGLDREAIDSARTIARNLLGRQ